MKQAVFLFTFLFIRFITLAQNSDSIQARIILIGDAGSLTNGRHYVISAVKKSVPLNSKTTVIYLGDNLYYTGLPDSSYPSYTMAKAVLDSQVTIAAGTDAKVYFIPGNHDWNRMGPNGWEAVVREQQYIDVLGDKNVKFYPEDGCPGPVQVTINKDIVLVIIDTQWWLHPYDKPGIESDCPYKTKEEVLNQLDDILSRNSKKLVIFAAHHPFKSYGIHGGYFTWKQHIFPLTDIKPNLYIPLPVIGSIYPITRSIFGTAQDLKHPAYQNMIKDLQKVIKDHSNVILVAGHEHNLQLIKDSSYYYIVSGAGTKETRVSDGKNLLYGAEANGFATLNVSFNKNVNFNFFTVDGDSVTHAYDSTLLNFATLPPEHEDSVKPEIVIPFKDSVISIVNSQYSKASGAKRFILGDNYRKEWAAPVHFKVLEINKFKGGLTPKSLGGGKQTMSLRLEDKNGKEWTLRSINKDPDKAIPANLKNSVAQDIVDDMISASHPYAPLAIPPLAKAINVPVASPQFYYVPDDPALGIYRNKFKESINLLEEREPTPDGGDTKSTAKVINKLFEDNDNRIDQKEVLRARLLDMLIGDWDRHFDQWRWGSYDTGKGKVYYAIPRDRDQAFFNSDGLFIKVVSKHLFPYLKGFKQDIPKVDWFNWEERDFDRLFLNQLNENDWKEIIANFQNNISDSLIKYAVNQMPPVIVAMDSATVIKKLISRRDLLNKKGITYYNFLSKKVKVVGSNKKETFLITQDGKDLNVKVYKRTNENEMESLMYNRSFNPDITKEIRLYGLNNADYFNVSPEAKANIKLRIIGGRGKDTFNIQGNVRTYLYDLSTEKNGIINKSHTKSYITPDPNQNDYTPTDYQYNIYRFPRLVFGFNPEDRLMLGVGLLRRTYGFRKEPYATQQKFNAIYALNRGSYQLNYSGEFNEVIGKNDLLVNASMVNPVLNNFFGLGNETEKDPDKSLTFYRVRYKYIKGDILIRKRFNSILHVSAGPTFYHYWDNYEDNINRILEKPSLVGLDSANIYSLKTYAGGKLSIIINNLDNVLLPTRGINWVTEFTSLGGLTRTSKPYTSVTSYMAVHAAVSDPAKVVAVMRIGAGHIFSENYEYFQSLSLGANNFLRGFRKNRFSGRSLAYGSLEMQIKLFDSKSYIFPGAVGLVAFNDVGRVWLKGENSEKWHDSYGAGFYYAAYNYVLISATVGFSKEEQLFNFSMGTKFNITF